MWTWHNGNRIQRHGGESGCREVPAEQPVDKVCDGSIGQGKDAFESPVVNLPVWVQVDKKPSLYEKLEKQVNKENICVF